jgi:hypothetical protein
VPQVQALLQGLQAGTGGPRAALDLAVAAASVVVDRAGLLRGGLRLQPCAGGASPRGGPLARLPRGLVPWLLRPPYCDGWFSRRSAAPAIRQVAGSCGIAR